MTVCGGSAAAAAGRAGASCTRSMLVRIPAPAAAAAFGEATAAAPPATAAGAFTRPRRIDSPSLYRLKSAAVPIAWRADPDVVSMSAPGPRPLGFVPALPLALAISGQASFVGMFRGVTAALASGWVGAPTLWRSSGQWSASAPLLRPRAWWPAWLSGGSRCCRAACTACSC